MTALAGAVVVTIRHRDDSLRDLLERGTIRVGYALEAPYAFLDPSGRVTGESPEVARRVVARLGIGKIEWRQLEFGELIPELVNRTVDVVAAGLFVTPERSKRVSFSSPTFRVRQGLLVPSGNPLALRSYEDAVARPRVVVAVLTGSVEADLFDLLGLPGSRKRVVPDARAGRAAVESGLADALALSRPTVRWLARDALHRGTQAAEPLQQPRAAGFEEPCHGAHAFRRQDRELRRGWSAALGGFIGSREHRHLVEPFGFGPEELPIPATAAAMKAAP